MTKAQQKINEISKLQKKIVAAMPEGKKKEKATFAINLADAICNAVTNKPQHGGVREGAGRPQLFKQPQKYYKIYCTEKLHKKVLDFIREEKLKKC